MAGYLRGRTSRHGPQRHHLSGRDRLPPRAGPPVQLGPRVASRRRRGWTRGTVARKDRGALAALPRCSTLTRSARRRPPTGPVRRRPWAVLLGGDAGMGKTRLLLELTDAGPGRRLAGPRGPLPRPRRPAAALPALQRARGTLRRRRARARGLGGGARPAQHPALAALAPRRRLLCGNRPGEADRRPAAHGCARRGERLPGDARRSWSGAGAARGPPLGRPVDARPPQLPARPPAAGTGASGRRRTAPTTCTGGTRCGRPWRGGAGCPACSASPSGRCPTPTWARWSAGLGPTESLAGLPERQVAEIVARAGGNAFFAEELVGESRSGDGDAVPTPLADLLLLRLDRLDEDARPVVRAAACAGRRVSHALLAAVVDLPPEGLDAALRVAVDSNVLVHRGEDELRLPPRAARRGGPRRPAARRAGAPARPVRRRAALRRRGGHGRRAGHPRPRRPRPPDRGPRRCAGGRGGHGRRRPRRRGPPLRGRPGARGPARRRCRTGRSTSSDSSGAPARPSLPAGQPGRALALVRDHLDSAPADQRVADRVGLLLAYAAAALLNEAWDAPTDETGEALALLGDEPSRERARALSLHARALLQRGAARRVGPGGRRGAWRWRGASSCWTSSPRPTATLALHDGVSGDDLAALRALEVVVEHAHDAGDVFGRDARTVPRRAASPRARPAGGGPRLLRPGGRHGPPGRPAVGALRLRRTLPAGDDVLPRRRVGRRPRRRRHRRAVARPPTRRRC